MENLCEKCFHKDVCEQYNEDRSRKRKVCDYLEGKFVDAKKVKIYSRGTWIFNDDWWEFRCSNCRKSIGNIEKYKYCPHCGSIMDL